MSLTVKAVRIGKGARLHPQRESLCVHQGHKAVDIPRRVAGQGDGGVISRHQQQPLQKLPDGIALSRGQIHGGSLHAAVFRQNLHLLVQGAVFQDHKGCHDLGGAGDQHFIVGILFKYHLAAAMHHDGTVGTDAGHVVRPGCSTYIIYHSRKNCSNNYFFNFNNKHHPCFFGQCLLLTDLLILFCDKTL